MGKNVYSKVQSFDDMAEQEAQQEVVATEPTTEPVTTDEVVNTSEVAPEPATDNTQTTNAE